MTDWMRWDYKRPPLPEPPDARSYDATAVLGIRHGT